MKIESIINNNKNDTKQMIIDLPQPISQLNSLQTSDQQTLS